MVSRAHERLANALWRVRSVYEEDARQRFWLCLPADVRARLSVAGDPYGFALSLVIQCCDQQRLGVMLRWLRCLENDSKPAMQVCELAEGLLEAEEWELSGQGRERDTWEQLRKALREVPYDDQVDLLCQRVVPLPPEQIEAPSPRNAWEAFLDLKEATLGPRGEDPGERFLQLLAEYTGRAELVRAVAEWGADQRHATVVKRSGWGGGEPFRPLPPPRLIIKIGYDLGNLERLSVAYRLVTDPDDDWMDVCEAEALTEVTEEELPRRISELIIWAESQQAADHGKLRLEFIFPFSLLFRFVVQNWLLELHEDAPAPSLGSQYEIIIRSEEFARDPRAQRICQRRWQNLHEGRGRVGSSSTVLEEGWENVANYLGNEAIVAFVAYALPGVDWQRQVYAAVICGVPVVAWRWTGKNGNPEAHFLSILRGEEEMASGKQEMNGLERGIKNLTKNLYLSRINRGTAEMRNRSRQSYDLSVIYHDYQPKPREQRQVLSGGNIR